MSSARHQPEAEGRQPTSMTRADTIWKKGDSPLWGQSPFFHINGGGGGNRTRVRKSSYYSFYTFSRLIVFLTTCPLNGKRARGQPVNFTGRFQAQATGYPELMAFRQVASGGLPGKRHSLIKLRGRSWCCQLLGFDLFYEGVTSTCYCSLCFPVESSSPPDRLERLLDK